ncbi:MAG: acyltransferase [Bacteroidetes bacterium]|nr:acyltransferase [Bacteroidota bacterium]
MIRPLTSLRFVFAFMVFCCHCSFYKTPGTTGFWLQWHVMNEGYIGVSFFFILSGFILSLNYADSFDTHSIQQKEFWLLRFARIFPLYLLMLLVEIPFTMHEFHHSASIWWARLFTCMFMLQSWVPDMSWIAAFNTPSWSISAESFFYAMFPLLVFWIKRPCRWILIIAGLAAALAVGMSLTDPHLQKIAFYNNPLARIGEFALGIVLYRLFAQRKRTWGFRYATQMELASIGVLFLFFFFHLSVPHVYRYSVYYWVPMSFLLYVFAHTSGYISRLMSQKICVVLGEISFAFYMVHYRVGGMLSIANRRLHIPRDSLAYFLLYFSTTLIVSACIYYFLEVPTNSWLRQKLLPARRSVVSTSQMKGA